MMVQRFKLTIEYDGTSFCGWQRQENVLSIQQIIEEAITKFVPAVSPSPILYVAGRTDAGVHALGQVAHVDLPAHFSESTVRRALNFYLEEVPITILKVEKVDADFHARFSARKRTYVYRIINRPDKLALERFRAWHVPFPLHIDLMQQAAQFLLGRHDFSAFRTVQCQAKDPVRTLEKLDIIQKEDVIECWVEAPSFLHHQVRNMVGTLVEVGRKKHTPVWIADVLASKDRSKAGPTAPAHGLYFVKVSF